MGGGENPLAWPRHRQPLLGSAALRRPRRLCHSSDGKRPPPTGGIGGGVRLSCRLSVPGHLDVDHPQLIQANALNHPAAEARRRQAAPATPSAAAASGSVAGSGTAVTVMLSNKPKINAPASGEVEDVALMSA